MKKLILILIILCFTITSVLGPCPVYAQIASPGGGNFRLPAPGVMVHLSPEFNPAILKGLKVHKDNPFRFDFILDQGDSNQEQLKQQATKLIKYFLASITIPEKDLWVNLSPYEKDRIVPQSFGLTEMGRDLLAEDYMLKQITASLIYPEDKIGKKFWKRVYEEAQKKFGTTNIPVNTFNKVWILPEKAVVYENSKAGTAYVVESKLKIMLEQDYLALSKNQPPTRGHVPAGNVSPSTLPSEPGLNAKAPQGNHLNDDPDINKLGSDIVREIVIPELTREVNEGKNFAQLRQVYNSLILATWYKKKIKASILAQVYADKNKVKGVEYTSSVDVDFIYQRYLQAFKKGVYNYIKEEQDPITQEVLPKKYFSGGEALIKISKVLTVTTDNAQVTDIQDSRKKFVVRANFNVVKDSAMLGDPEDLLKRIVNASFKKLLSELKRKKISYDLDFLYLLNGIRSDVEAIDTESMEDYLQGLEMPRIFFNMTDEKGYLSDQLLINFISDLANLMALRVQSGFEREYEIEGGTNRRDVRKGIEDFLKETFRAQRQKVRVLDLEKMMRVSEEKARIQRERFLEAERQRAEERAARLSNEMTQRSPLPEPPAQQPPPQLRKEKVIVPIRDNLDKLLERWNEENGLRHMARNSKTLKEFLDLLSKSSLTRLTREEVEKRFTEFALARGMTKEGFFENLQRTRSEKTLSPSQTPGQRPVHVETPLSILIYKHPTYFNKAEWEKYGTNVVLPLLRDAFLDKNLETTKVLHEYTLYPGIYRFKVLRKRFSIYVRFYKDKETKRLLVFGFDIQDTFHPTKDGTKLKPKFSAFLENFDNFIQESANRDHFEQVQDGAMVARRDFLKAAAAATAAEFLNRLHAQSQNPTEIIRAPSIELNGGKILASGPVTFEKRNWDAYVMAAPFGGEFAARTDGRSTFVDLLAMKDELTDYKKAIASFKNESAGIGVDEYGIYAQDFNHVSDQQALINLTIDKLYHEAIHVLLADRYKSRFMSEHIEKLIKEHNIPMTMASGSRYLVDAEVAGFLAELSASKYPMSKMVGFFNLGFARSSPKKDPPQYIAAARVVVYEVLGAQGYTRLENLGRDSGTIGPFTEFIKSRGSLRMNVTAFEVLTAIYGKGLPHPDILRPQFVRIAQRAVQNSIPKKNAETGDKAQLTGDREMTGQVIGPNQAMMTRGDFLKVGAAAAAVAALSPLEKLYAQPHNSIEIIGAPSPEYDHFVKYMNEIKRKIYADPRLVDYGVIKKGIKEMNDDIDRILSTKNIKDLKRALSAIRKKLKTGTIDVIGMELSPEELTAFNKGMSDMLSFFKKWGISIKNLDDFILGEFGPLPYLQYKNELGHVKLKGLADFKSRKKLFSLADSYITSYQSLFNTVSKIQQASFKIELDKIIDSIKNDEDFTPPSVEVVDQLLRKYAGIKREDVDNVIKTYINFIRVAILEQNEYFFKNTKNLKGHVLIYTTTLHVKRLKSMFEKDGREVESEEIWPSDAAMMTVSLTKKINSPLGQNKEGGIDLTPANMNLQVNHDTADAFQFHLDPAMLAQLQNAPGFVPVIINIQPLKSLPEFLELAQNPKNL